MSPDSSEAVVKRLFTLAPVRRLPFPDFPPIVEETTREFSRRIGYTTRFPSRFVSNSKPFIDQGKIRLGLAGALTKFNQQYRKLEINLEIEDDDEAIESLDNFGLVLGQLHLARRSVEVVLEEHFDIVSPQFNAVRRYFTEEIAITLAYLLQNDEEVYSVLEKSQDILQERIEHHDSTMNSFGHLLDCGLHLYRATSRPWFVNVMEDLGCHPLTFGEYEIFLPQASIYLGHTIKERIEKTVTKAETIVRNKSAYSSNTDEFHSGNACGRGWLGGILSIDDFATYEGLNSRMHFLSFNTRLLGLSMLARAMGLCGDDLVEQTTANLMFGIAKHDTSANTNTAKALQLARNPGLNYGTWSEEHASALLTYTIIAEASGLEAFRTQRYFSPDRSPKPFFR
jgi:hypothetical protein